MTRTLPLSHLLANLDAFADQPEEVTVTRQGEPVFSILPQDLYQSLLETLDLTANQAALAVLQDNLSELQAGRPLRVKPMASCKGPWAVHLTPAAQQHLQTLEKPEARKDLTRKIKALARDPEGQGRPLVGALKRYRSFKHENHQIVYLVENRQIVVVLVFSEPYQPAAKLIRLLKSS